MRQFIFMCSSNNIVLWKIFSDNWQCFEKHYIIISKHDGDLFDTVFGICFQLVKPVIDTLPLTVITNANSVAFYMPFNTTKNIQVELNLTFYNICIIKVFWCV